MKFLVLNADYPDFLRWLYQEHPGLEAQPYEEQLKVRIGSLYGVADFYSSNLRALGHEAHDLYANNEALQRSWAHEGRMAVHRSGLIQQWMGSFLRGVRGIAGRTPARRLKPYIGARARWPKQAHDPCLDILKAQIKHYKPDVLLNQAVDSIPGRFLKELKPSIRFLVGQHAATPLREGEDLSGYDLMISSFPATVDLWQQQGLRAQLCRLGFEPRVLSLIENPGKKWDISFIGSFFNVHSSRVRWLETLCRHFPQLKAWAPSIGDLSPMSPIREHYAGQAWGRQMYQILASSKLILNHHGDVAPYANNMRLFEATGVGTCLLTDWKANLGDMFTSGREVLAYRNTEECVQLIERYLQHDAEREAIARAGQARTLREHTYYHRMQEFIGILGKYL